MEAKRLVYFKRLLLKKKEELEDQLAEIEAKFVSSQQEASNDLSAYPLHTADLATDAETREEESLVISSIVNELDKVNKAIEKIDSNTYGLCEKCGSEISERRLKLIPYAEFCTKCGSPWSGEEKR
ncbi:MAG: TraR/DksA family transcriptional regulator [bacterium]|nr:TraR/DksA family transcriptional regulator [bacterium]